MKHSSYEAMVEYVLMNGAWKRSRGAKTLSCFNQCVEVDLQGPAGFPLVATRKLPWKSIVLETLWYLSGQDSVELLHEHGVHFWDEWADEDGSIDSPYGRFWRNWGALGVDQLGNVVETLRENPESRRLVMTAWDPENVLISRLPPCHIMQIFHTERSGSDEHTVNLHVTQRSADIAIGVPFNIASYALLLEIVCWCVGRSRPVRPGKLAITFVDAHIYAEAPYDHRVGLLEQVRRARRGVHLAPLLRFHYPPLDLEALSRLLETHGTREVLDMFCLHNYFPDPPITYEVMP